MIRKIFLLLLFFASTAFANPTPNRIVSVAPGFTEILYALGVGKHIVGTTEYCDYPPEAKLTEKIGDVVNPNIEKIIALHPDVVFVGKWKWKVPETLRSMKINVVEIPDAEKVSDIFERITLIAKNVGKEKEAGQIVSKMKSDLESIRKEGEHDVKRSAYMELDTGNWTIGGTSFFDEVLNYAGAQNIFHDRQEAYLMVTTESIVARNPLVFLSLFRKKQDIMNSPAFEALSSVKNGNTLDKSSMNWDMITRQSPRLIEGIKTLRQLVQAIH